MVGDIQFYEARATGPMPFYRVTDCCGVGAAATRLFVARELLNNADSVLIVAIDEKEYHRLGLLLEQTFQKQEPSGEQ